MSDPAKKTVEVTNKNKVGGPKYRQVNLDGVLIVDTALLKVFKS